LVALLKVKIAFSCFLSTRECASFINIKKCRFTIVQLKMEIDKLNISGNGLDGEDFIASFFK